MGDMMDDGIGDLTLEHVNSDELILRFPRRHAMGWCAGACFVIIAVSAMVVFVPYHMELEIPVAVKLAVIALVAVIAGYMAIKRFCNRTRLMVGADSTIEIEIGPIPWTRKYCVVIADILTVQFKKRESKGYGGRPQDRGSTAKMYDILLDLENGKTRFLIKGLPTFRSAMEAKDQVAVYLDMVKSSEAGGSVSVATESNEYES